MRITHTRQVFVFGQRCCGMGGRSVEPADHPGACDAGDGQENPGAGQCGPAEESPDRFADGSLAVVRSEYFHMCYNF